MKRITMTNLRKDVWKSLKSEVNVIRIQKTADNCSARVEYNDNEIDIWVDSYDTRIDYAVIHEILHKILDKHFEKTFTYHVYEYFITSLERPFFKYLSRVERNKWKREIKKKVIYTRIK